MGNNTTFRDDLIAPNDAQPKPNIVNNTSNQPVYQPPINIQPAYPAQIPTTIPQQNMSTTPNQPQYIMVKMPNGQMTMAQVIPTNNNNINNINNNINNNVYPSQTNPINAVNSVNSVYPGQIPSAPMDHDDMTDNDIMSEGQVT
eukprot:CAMPEP_0114672606 /NCGR_PEP_ID=MMETSP0191-20121206/43211_1 /TAXON_ID=126664 /ORGANISM="Sorites sp." /LENGTH=143 /DNA_ID=CAMNT_0001935387 /DNA_START=327 /DNA_END=756 /DNA_ORIENTATION=-